MSGLEDLSQSIHDRLASFQRLLDLSSFDLPQNKMRKLAQELFAIERLLEEYGRLVSQKKNQIQHLKTLEQSSMKYLEELQHLQNNVPDHLPEKKCQAIAKEPGKTNSNAGNNQPQPEKSKKTCKGFIREMEIITVGEYESIPQYMKGRVSYDQLNAAVRSINVAVSSKYKIVQQSAKTLNNFSRKLQQRFKEQETKDTKGYFFIVEADIREFTETKFDKKFQGILNMLRHCQRMRELRGGGLTRFVLL